MIKIAFGHSTQKTPPGLEGLDLEKALRKIPTKELAIITFKQMNDHMNVCAKNSEATLKALKFVVYIVVGLALEKLNEMFHFVQNMPTLPGGN